MPTYRADDGVELYHRDEGPSGAVPVLLHHGFGADGRLDWTSTGVEGALLAVGRRVITPDARGHGRSGKPHDPARYGEPRMALDVSALLDRLGIDAVDLVGYSMGAVVALLTTVRDRRVRRLAVGGIGAGAVECGGVDTRVLAPEVLRAALLAEDPSGVTDPGAAAFRAFADQTGADRRALAAQAQAMHRDRIPVETITVAVLVLAGRDDGLAARPHVLAGAITGARLQLVDGDHGAALRAPELARALVGFLAG